MVSRKFLVGIFMLSCSEKLDLRLPEVRESESKTRPQAEILKKSLDENGLELRVRASNEAESACEQRLSAAKAEIEEFMQTTTLIMDMLH